MFALTMMSRPRPHAYPKHESEPEPERKTLSDEFKEAEMRGIRQAKREMHNDDDDSHNYSKEAGGCAIQ
jgi:hypothetical protein